MQVLRYVQKSELSLPVEMKDKFSDDLHIYPITEKRNLLNLHVLKFDPSILALRENPGLIHRTPYR